MQLSGDHDLIGVADRYGESVRQAAFAVAYVIKQRRLGHPPPPQVEQLLAQVRGDLAAAERLIFDYSIDQSDQCDVAKRRVSSAADGLRQIMGMVSFG
jgi:hypothetical protein